MDIEKMTGNNISDKFMQPSSLKFDITIQVLNVCHRRVWNTVQILIKELKK